LAAAAHEAGLLKAEKERLRARGKEQKQIISSLQGDVEEKDALLAALHKRNEQRAQKEAAASAMAPNVEDKKDRARRDADELKTRLQKVKGEHATRLKQKNVLIQTLRRQLKATADRLQKAEDAAARRATLNAVQAEQQQQQQQQQQGSVGNKSGGAAPASPATVFV